VFVWGGLGGRTGEVPVTADSGVSSGEAFAGEAFFLLLGVEVDLEADLDSVALDAGTKKGKMGKMGKGRGHKDRHRGLAESCLHESEAETLGNQSHHLLAWQLGLAW
jgi:hypothetical protein